MGDIKINVVSEDILSFSADVLALKYAQDLYGVDAAVYNRLSIVGDAPTLPKTFGFTLVKSSGLIAAAHVLFIGVKSLWEFGYFEIRAFAQKVLETLAKEMPGAQHLALTIHGTGYGLDEVEAFESELAGLLDAIESGDFPESLREISFVENNVGKAKRLSASLKRLLPTGCIPINGSGSLNDLKDKARTTLKSAGYSAASKPHVFVAMPFTEEMDDVFHYGIQGAVNTSGLLCERADLSSYTGDVMEYVKRRISSAKLVIADLSSANPNVYLEIGYAWACRVPTILVVRDATELQFDVKGQRCIVYNKSIKKLEDALQRELKAITNP